MTYEEVRAILEDKPDNELLGLLEEKSRKVGDNAWAILRRRRQHSMVADALEHRKIRTRDGKVRALNLLSVFGRSVPRACQSFKQYCSDRSSDVVDCALMGLCLWGNQDAISYLSTIQSARDAERIERAIRSLNEGNYNIYSPGFRDDAGVWNPQGEQAQALNP